MRRLVHHPRGWARSHQQSETNLFIYVEGKSYDIGYYEHLLRDMLANSGVKYLFQLSRNIPNPRNLEGKSALIEAHDFLDGIRLLRNSFASKKTAVLFFVDKDVDDLKGSVKIAPGIVYTKFYCVENHILVESRLARAMALAASADSGTMERLLGNQADWSREATEVQKRWVVACLAAQMFDMGYPNYSASTLVNVSSTGKYSPAKWASHFALMLSKSKLSKAALNRNLRVARRVVDGLYTSGRQDEVFKGKWYTPFLEVSASKLGTANYDRSAFRHAIWPSMISQVDVGAPSSEAFRNAVNDALTWLAKR